MDCILAIDIGTTSTKALVVQPDGRVLFASNAGYATYYPQPGYAEQSPDEIFAAVKKVIRDSCAAQGARIKAVSFSCAMHSLIAVDQAGRALTPVILWADARSDQQAKAIRNSDKGNLIYKTTGTPIHPMSPLCKLAWWKENDSGVFNLASRFVSIKEYVLYQLTSKWAVDYSIASATGMFDASKIEWMPAALEAAGINESQLSPIVSPYTVFVGLSEQLASDLNLPREIPFVIGASDGCLANLGSNVMKPGELSITVGTSGAVRTTSTQFNSDTQQRLFCYRLDDDYFITGGATNNGSVLLSWFSQHVLNEKADAASFLSRALKTKPGAEGLLFLPYIYGERAPFYNPDARGAYVGLAQHHTQAHLMRALVEGICFELKSITDAVEDNAGAVTSIVASGGFTLSDGWVQMLADILGKEIQVKGASDASALGAAKMGFRAMNLPYSFDEENTTKHFKPEQIAVYPQLYSLFKEMTGSLQGTFDRLAAIQKSAN